MEKALIEYQLATSQSTAQFFIKHKKETPDYLQGFIDGLKFALEEEKGEAVK